MRGCLIGLWLMSACDRGAPKASPKAAPDAGAALTGERLRVPSGDAPVTFADGIELGGEMFTTYGPHDRAHTISLRRGAEQVSIDARISAAGVTAEVVGLGKLFVVDPDRGGWTVMEVSAPPAPITEEAGAELIEGAANAGGHPMDGWDARAAKVDQGVLEIRVAEEGAREWRGRVGLYTRRVFVDEAPGAVVTPPPLAGAVTLPRDGTRVALGGGLTAWLVASSSGPQEVHVARGKDERSIACTLSGDLGGVEAVVFDTLIVVQERGDDLDVLAVQPPPKEVTWEEEHALVTDAAAEAGWWVHPPPDDQPLPAEETGEAEGIAAIDGYGEWTAWIGRWSRRVWIAR